MGIRKFEIELAQGRNAVITAGQWLRGRVRVHFDKPTKARKIYVRLYGAADVHWTETETTGSGKDSQTRSVSYTNHETYFEHTTPVWQSESSGPRHPAGEVVYSFEYQLPATIPSSFEGEAGYVRYLVECRIDRPWKFDHKAKLPFTVNSVLDLNQYPQTREPHRSTNSKTLCCWCCKSGPITNTLTLERGGYVPGEFIVLNGEVDNKSNRAMKSSTVMLRQVTTFHATNKSRCSIKKVAQFKRGEIAPGDSEMWSGQLARIPPLPPSGLIHCKIMDIKYYIVMITEPSGPALKLETPCEVTIGTVPLHNTHHVYSSLSPVVQAPAQDHVAATASPATKLSLEDPPPSYEECIYGHVSIRGKDDQYTHGRLEYTPHYPYYSWNDAR